MTATQPEVGTYDSTVYQWQATDAVQGAVSGDSPPHGLANLPLLNLANRTGWLKAQITTIMNFITSSRTRMTGPITLYVSPTGNDSNPGTSGAPFATIQAATFVALSKYDTAGYNITISVANATYTAGASMVNALFGGGTLVYLASAGATINATNASCFVFDGGAVAQINGFTLNASGTATGQGSGIAGANCEVSHVNCNFGTCAGNHIIVGNAGSILWGQTGTYTISGSTPIHASSFKGDYSFKEAAVTLVGTPNFSTAFVYANNCGTISAPGTFSGSATGVQYLAVLNGVVNLPSGGPYPGNATGNTLDGGQAS